MRTIGFTRSEFVAIERGATAILGEPRGGMPEIVEGQELLAIDGWNFGDLVSPGAKQVRLRVAGPPVFVRVENLQDFDAVKILGLVPASKSDLLAFCCELAVERRDGFDLRTPKLLIPVCPI
jgi:hypothetical protein